MTNEEAVNGLTKFLWKEEKVSDEVILKAIEALEKQIPKKAQKEVKIDGDYYFCCPTCERPIASKFCPDCGQAILEGDEE